MHCRRWVASVAISALLGACAGGPPPQGPAPQDLATLEAASAQHPTDAALMTQLGAAYYDSTKYDRARDVLRSALVISRQNYTAHVYLGLAYEELGVFDSARASFTTASSQARDDRQRGEIQGHLNLLTRRELQAAARAAIAQEAALSAQPPQENTLAVFPFRYAGTNAELAPLGVGLTHLMITDLAKITGLTLLEREQVQALVSELALTESGRVDAASGARSGRMLRAARVVQGAVGDVPGKTDIQLDATVVNATNASVVATGQGTDQLQQLFALQKAVLFRLLDQMQIPLTPAERRALSERPTADLQAFLLFSRGLEAADRGDFQTAEADFNAAAARDPNFRAASQKAREAQLTVSAQQITPPVLAGLGPRGPQGATPGVVGVSGRGPILQTTILSTIPSLGSTLTNRVGSQTGPVSRQPGAPAPLPEALGADNAGTPGGLIGTVIIIISRP